MEYSESDLQIKIPKEELRKFCRRKYIRKMALFGSVLTDRFRKNSDIDVLVEFDPAHVPGLFELTKMEFELGDIFHRKVDLRTPLDLSPYFREDVLAGSYKIYGKERFNPSKTHA